MSEEADVEFKALLPKIAALEEKYERVRDADPITRGHIGKDILALVDKAGVSTEYLRHCEQQVERDLPEPKRARIELIIRILGSQNNNL